MCLSKGPFEGKLWWNKSAINFIKYQQKKPQIWIYFRLFKCLAGSGCGVNTWESDVDCWCEHSTVFSRQLSAPSVPFVPTSDQQVCWWQGLYHDDNHIWIIPLSIEMILIFSLNGIKSRSVEMLLRVHLSMTMFGERGNSSQNG